jgi:hypothetical protein
MTLPLVRAAIPAANKAAAAPSDGARSSASELMNRTERQSACRQVLIDLVNTERQNLIATH